ncbi:MAG: uroporphyrinogen-III C-methyltransferase [Acidiferrobacter sp.]
MVDENDSTTKATPTPPSPRRARSPAGGLALLLSLITLVGLGYLWYALSYQAHVMGLNVGQRLRSQNQAQARLEQTVAGLTQSDARTQQALQALKQRLQTAQSVRNNGRRWHVRAAEDLLLIANDQLHFEHNVPLAILALHQAQREIRRQGDPRLLPVRTAILQEILSLQALRKQHVSTMALELVALARTIPHLPLAIPTTFRVDHSRVAKKSEPKFWRRVAHGLWQDFVDIIRIHKEPIHERALLAPKRAYFVRENLRVRLYAAELALLEHHGTVMHANLLAADRWIGRYFDKKAPGVQVVRKKLQNLEQRSIALTWPDISRSLHLLRHLTHEAS